MKRNLMLLLGVLGVALSAMAFSGTSMQSTADECPLRGTPLCPQYPSCCN